MGEKLHRCRYSGCRNLIAITSAYCKEHKRNSNSDKQYNKLRQNSNRTSTRVKFYKSTSWKHIRQTILKRDNNLCQYHLRTGELVIGNIVDHIVPFELDSKLKVDMNNLVTTCKTCHNAKTKWEQSYYGTGSKNVLNKNVLYITDIKYLPDFTLHKY